MKSSAVHPLHDDIAIVGWACRLPGARSVDELWSLLLEGRCAISRVPDDRFPLDQFGHPRRQEKGKSYTWAAGILDDIWGFDPAVFGISPREAVQIDPQQRILLQLTWEALEDAGIPPSSIADTEVGVFVGASQTDYGHAFFTDPAIADAHFGPGTALAILSNRISYIYGLHGPSVTVDTACSSSLVALHHAMEALKSGRIDTAIVGGSNLIASPASFIAFSQANMLSPRGLCQAFSAGADGFVRAEGAMVLLLRRKDVALARQNPIHGLVLATDVNSDGRTNGISLPNIEAQEALLTRVYGRNDIDPDRLAFVEAHGTGTPAGDPIEATAIGRGIAQKRGRVLPIGSIKTNIGHLEPASGLAGLLKAVMALNHGVLPPSLHFDEPNPHIEFEELNISVCTQPLLLPQSTGQYAGVNSFGFGGTNAHVVVAGGSAAPPPAADAGEGCDVFTLSADSSASLRALARRYGDRIDRQPDAETAVLASAVIHRRERQATRLVISSTRTEEVTGALEAFVAGADHPKLTLGTAVGREMPVAFVYSGNGGQWVGMGRVAYRNNAAFRSRFEQVDSYFKEVGGWSLKEAMLSDDLAERLSLTSVAQPLLFAIQSASTVALREAGLLPAAVLGHSVGEVGAAEAAGVLDLRTAIKVIHFRSLHQETVRGMGRMAAMLASAEKAAEILDEVAGVEIAAINSPRMVTVAGPADAVAKLKAITKKRGIALLDLGLEYPFHTAIMDALEEPLEADLGDMKAHDAATPFISTVTGACMPGSRLNGRYWWRNVREPVEFMAAIRAAAELGARYFVEIGPRATLLQHVMDSLQGQASGYATYGALDRSDADVDPFARARAHALVTGARIDMDRVFGADPGPGVALPRYPWQQTEYRFKPTVEAVSGDPGLPRLRFAGARSRVDSVDWRSHIDTSLFPGLLDHRLGDQTIFPGTGFIEISLEVARQWLEVDRVTLSDFEIINPLDLTNGETREILTRVSPESNVLEIFSRPRLSQVSWLLHCRCKVQGFSGAELDRDLDLPDGGRVMTQPSLYGVAEASGLPYGPTFRLVREAVTLEDDHIVVDLTPSEETTPFVLDPMRLDACGHGMFTLFPELRAVERGVTYIPVRLAEISLLRPHVPPRRAVIEITSKSDRFIVGDTHIHGADGELVAVLRGVRSQAVPMRRIETVEGTAFVERPQLIDGAILGEVGVGTDARSVAEGAAALDMTAEDAGAPGEAELLVEGWATTAAYEVASALADGGSLDVEALVSGGRIPEAARIWLLGVLFSLEAAGLATREGSSWTLAHDSSLPKASTVVRAIATEQQGHAGEMLMAAAMLDVARQLTDGDRPDEQVAVPRVALDFYTTTDVALREWSGALYRLLTADEGLWPHDRKLRVLQVGFSPLAHMLLSSPRELRLTVFEPDRRRFGSAEIALSRNREVALVDAEHPDALGEYDLVVAAGGLHRLPRDFGLDELGGHVAPGGLVVALEPAPSLFRDLVLGLDPDWFTPGVEARPLSPLRSPGRWRGELEGAGFADVRTLPVRPGSELGYLVVAGKGKIEAAEVPEAPTEEEPADAVAAAPHATRTHAVADEPPVFVVAPAGVSELVSHLVDGLAGTGEPPTVVAGATEWPAVAPRVVAYVPELEADPGDPVVALTRRCLDIKACAEAIGDEAATLWLVFSGALVDGTSPVRPVETGAWAFTRTLANEFPKLDVRRIDVAPDVSSRTAAERIRAVMASGTRETELHVGEKALRAVRVTGLGKILDSDPLAQRVPARLERRSRSGQRLSWEPAERTRPGPGRVEVEVEATGLNFRDVMWSLSLLPEDMLEDGFSGPTLGLECAGRVVRIGEGVHRLAVGDRVMAFAASSFSSYVTIEARQAVKLPDAVSCEAAATIPVAFFTAYYSLITQAALRRREWVLIHGGAGAVGMAAIQIARAKGAKIIATAGSPAKRDLLRALGVTHVFDSRSTRFVDEVRRVAPEGVDVVLNSLAGEAMERSLSCLRPFGRFVELGKRDYVTNTHVGLRPFRRNLSYFGVDVDQVIGERRALSDRVFGRILRHFEKGSYVPLPYSVFDGGDASTAFHLMQQSGHVGKIVVRPPPEGVERHPTKAFRVSAAGTHVVTGGFGGFGMETARWLVDKGARHLVMIGRRGAATEEARAVLEDFAARGVKVLAEPCDVTDRQALGALFETIHATMPPVVGVIHAAMVLDDGILANLDSERFHRVLAPKIAGAENLDRLVRGEKLDYFVLYSSVTTLVGNPGQANYVAANAYMEGLARRRRQAGLPALAIGWGPILDVGVVAQDERLQSGLQKLTGVTGMRAREALALMEQALQQPDSSPELAVMTITPSDGSFGADRLAVLRSPTYEAYVSLDRRGEGEGGSIDLRAFAAREGVEATRRKVAEVIGSELAHVLQLREEDISQVRPLAEIGLDSLMALELVMSLEERFGIRMPLTGASGGMTVADIADQVIAHVGLEREDGEDGEQHDGAVASIAKQHHGEVDPAQVEALKEMMEEETRKVERLLS